MNLDRELLFRFFNKETTLEEEKKIRLWIDECDEHRCEFFRERQLFDAILLHGDPSYEKSRPRFYIPWHKVVATLSGIAAIVILTIITTTYFLQQSFRDEVMNTVTVPQGQRVHLTLSDGTKVWLNAKTKMEYPQSFKVSDQRIVKVDGEAYFEVSKNKEKPFIVKTTKGDVEVLGTKFYISAYATTDVFETSLIEGKVTVYHPETQNEIILNPHEKVEVRDGKLYKETFTSDHDFLWRMGIYSFKDEPLETVFKKLEQYYEVKIINKNIEITSHPCTGKFRQKEGIEHVMRVLQKYIKFNYIQDDEKNQIIIY